MRLSDLRRARIRTLDGKGLGRVHEVHADGGRIIALTCGPGSLIERLTARSKGRRISWESVARMADGQIFVIPDRPPGKASKPSSASRSRRGTRRPNEPRSER